MGTPRTLVALLFLAVPGFGQQPQSNHFKLEGVVVNSVTGKPLPRVLVQAGGHAMLTGPEGEFSFDNIPAGWTQIAAQKPGYFPPGAKPLGGSMGPGIDVGPDTGKVVVKMSPEVVITGRVTGQDDEALERASVEVLAYMSINDGPQQLRPARSAVLSDEDGNFRVAGLPAGHYYVSVRAGNLTRSVLGVQTPQVSKTYPPLVYYPGTEDLSAAGMIDLAPGQLVEAPFSLALRPAYKVSGTVVTTGEWKQVNSPAIVDGAGQLLFAADMFDAKTGAFEFRAVPAGTYTVRLGGTDAKDHSSFSHHKITISKTVADLKLSLRPGLDLPVVVRAEYTKPQAATGMCAHTPRSGPIQQSDCSDYPAARVELIAADATGLQFGTEYGPLKDPSAFGVHGVAPGKYFVRAQAMFGGYVQSVSYGGLDLLREPLTVSEGGAVMPIEVVVRDDSATLKVTVRADQPSRFATVLLYPEGALLLSPTHRTTTAKEAYFGPLAPGNYKVFAFDSTSGADYARPDVLAKYASQAANVTATANHESDVIVDVIHTED